MAYRNPAYLAKVAATADVVSGGRVEMGIGAGWYDSEHVAYGIPFPSMPERFDRLEEQLKIITGLWRTPPGGQFSFTGEHYSIVGSPTRRV